MLHGHILHPARCPACAAILPPEIPGNGRIDNCPSCQATLSDGVFDDHTARHAASAELSAAQIEAHERREASNEQQRQRRSALRKQFRADLVNENLLFSEQTSLVVIVPNYNGQMKPLSDERKQRFLARLTSMAEEAVEEESTGSTWYGAQQPSDQVNKLHDAVPRNACATCRGACCTNGGEHAFFTRDVLRQRAKQHGFDSAAELVAAYAALLPDESNEGSCVFHTDKGCAQPTDMRSFTCNAFVCSGLDDFRLNPPGNDVTEIAIVSQREGERLRERIVRENSS